MRSIDTQRSTDAPLRDGRGLRVGIVVSRFNDTITTALLQSATATLESASVSAERCTIVQVPGAFEIPVVAATLARAKAYDGVLCLGCVIRGETPHFDHICRTVLDALQQIAVETGKPVVSGVLAVETLAQAQARAGGALGNLGDYGARTLLEMCAVMKTLHCTND